MESSIVTKRQAREELKKELLSGLDGDKQAINSSVSRIIRYYQEDARNIDKKKSINPESNGSYTKTTATRILEDYVDKALELSKYIAASKVAYQLGPEYCKVFLNRVLANPNTKRSNGSIYFKLVNNISLPQGEVLLAVIDNDHAPLFDHLCDQENWTDYIHSQDFENSSFFGEKLKDVLCAQYLNRLETDVDLIASINRLPKNIIKLAIVCGASNIINSMVNGNYSKKWRIAVRSPKDGAAVSGSYFTVKELFDNSKGHTIDVYYLHYAIMLLFSTSEEYAPKILPVIALLVDHCYSTNRSFYYAYYTIMNILVGSGKSCHYNNPIHVIRLLNQYLFNPSVYMDLNEQLGLDPLDSEEYNILPNLHVDDDV